MSSPDSQHHPDAALRTALRDNVLAPPGHAEQATLEALQNRILTQWAAQHPTLAAHRAPVGMGSGSGGTAAGLLWGGAPPKQRQWQLSAGVAVLVLLMVLGLQVTQSGRDANIDDLLEPDVLALIAMGEL
jgi:hypothetical protein